MPRDATTAVGVVHLAMVVVCFMRHCGCCNGHTYGYHGLTGVDPPNEPNLPAITGPFEVEAVVRLDDLVHTDDRVVVQYSTVDSNGSIHDVISMDITSPKTDIQLRLQPRGGVWCIVKAVQAVVQGEVATFSAGVQSNGTAWIAKNGLVYAQSTCLIPNNVVRNSKLIGRNQFNSAHRFRGAVLGVKIKNLNQPNILAEQEYQNLPGQIFNKPFTVSFWARFDELSSRSWQKVFDFCTNLNQDSISFGQQDNDDNRVEFFVCRGTSSCRSVDSTISSGLLGIWSFWHVGITNTSTLFIQRTGGTLDTNPDEPLPNNVYRSQLHLGKSCQAANSNFWGAILGLRVDIDGAS